MDRKQPIRLNRKDYEDFATLASILRALDVLESSMTKDLIGEDEYQPNCTKLLRQLFTQKKMLESASEDFNGIEEFLDDYDYSCEHARHRAEVGIAEDLSGATSGGAKSVYAFELAQYFITAKDSLELGNSAVDDLLPYISDIVQGMNKIDIPMSDPSYKAKEKILEWHSKLHRMKAVDVLNDDEIRQLKLDLETSQGLIYQSLGPKGRQ